MAEVLSHSESSVCFCGMHGRMWRERRKEERETHGDLASVLLSCTRVSRVMHNFPIEDTVPCSCEHLTGSLAALVSAPDTSKGGFP